MSTCVSPWQTADRGSPLGELKNSSSRLRVAKPRRPRRKGSASGSRSYERSFWPTVARSAPPIGRAGGLAFGSSCPPRVPIGRRRYNLSQPDHGDGRDRLRARYETRNTCCEPAAHSRYRSALLVTWLVTWPDGAVTPAAGRRAACSAGG